MSAWRLAWAGGLAAASVGLVLQQGGPSVAASSTLAAPLAASSAMAAPVAAAEPPRTFPEPPQVEYPDWPYSGKFTMARIRFRPTWWGFSNAYTFGLDLKWNHDYPQAEVNFMKILDEITDLGPFRDGGNIMEIDDPRLFLHPWAYLCEVGFWNPTDEQARILREYVLKGGFLMIDDFFDRIGDPPIRWNNFEKQIKRVFPGVILYPIHPDHPALRVFFQIDDTNFNDEDDPVMQGFVPKIYGIFEDNDASKRLMVAINYNMDIGDYWEWSDVQGVYPVHLTEKGFKLGVNYVMYGVVR